MSRLTPNQRREIAGLHQAGGLSARAIAERGFHKSAVQRWMNVDFTGIDDLFTDKARPPHYKFSPAVRRAVGRDLEADKRNIARATAEKRGMCKSTVYNIAKEECVKVAVTSAVVLDSRQKGCRSAYAKDLKGRNQELIAWGDHLLVEVPPMSRQREVFRTHGSTKPVPKPKRFKQRTSFLIYLFACSKGIAPPICEVRKRRLKRRRNGESTLGYTWQVERVNQARIEQHLTKKVFPWMEEQKLDELVLDNAPCQDQLRSFIEAAGVKSRGFASKRVDDRGGFPPQSPDFMLLDAVVNNLFKQLWADYCPMTIYEGQRDANKIVAELNERDVCRKWVAHLDDLCDEVVAKGGGASHHMQ